MLDLDADLLMLQPADTVVLQAYLAAEQALVAARPAPAAPDDSEDPFVERSRWVTRIRECEGALPDSMAPIHGRLIAGGYLHFQLQGREEGVVYRVSSEGRALLAVTIANAATPEPLRKSA